MELEKFTNSNDLTGKTPEESQVEMIQLVLPNDTNLLGNLLGGRLMHWIDIAGAVAALVALTISPLAALLVIILFLAVQMLENTFIVPKVMQKAIGISPVVIILAIIAGAKLLGVVGAIISIPIAASISVLIMEWPTISKMFSKEN